MRRISNSLIVHSTALVRYESHFLWNWIRLVVICSRLVTLSLGFSFHGQDSQILSEVGFVTCLLQTVILYYLMSTKALRVC